MLTVAINAALDLASSSGVEQATAALVHGLAGLDSSEERYLVITSPLAPAWIRPPAGGDVRVLVAPHSLFDRRGTRELRLRDRVRRVAGPLLPLARKLVTRGAARSATDAIPVSDGFIESLGPQVVHFPYQRYLRTGLPAIYEPWDLQHRHLPEFFTPQELARREALYRPACEEAAAVVVSSDWIRADVIEQFGLSPVKVFRIRRGPPTTLIPEPTAKDLRSLKERLRLPDAFLLYPAQTWPHKNHQRLLQAIARLRDSMPEVPKVVCCGTQTGDFGRISRRLDELQLHEHVRFIGRVGSVELRALYRLSRGVIFPSLFEGYGFPVLEGFSEGVPVASSNVTCLPELAGSGAILFDPSSVDEIADAIATLWSRPDVRERLVREGRRRVPLFDHRETARTYRALYRFLGGSSLNEEELELLEAARGGG